MIPSKKSYLQHSISHPCENSSAPIASTMPRFQVPKHHHWTTNLESCLSQWQSWAVDWVQILHRMHELSLVWCVVCNCVSTVKHSLLSRKLIKNISIKVIHILWLERIVYSEKYWSVRHDMSMSTTMTIWSWVCSGKGRGLGWSYLSNTIPLLMVLQVWYMYITQYIYSLKSQTDLLKMCVSWSKSFVYHFVCGKFIWALNQSLHCGCEHHYGF